jgi:hydroxymethylpyrimidine pyrophosphatase-like HAD family hydrolase
MIAAGDSYNDLPLLEVCGLRIVMGDAPDELKAIADYVAPSIDEDGLAVAIEEFVLPRL